MMFEKSLCILAANVHLIREVDLGRVEPLARVLVRLVGVVDGEEDAVRTDLMDAVLQSGAGEVTRGGDPDVLLEVLVDRLLAGLVKPERLLDVLQPMVDAPEIERDVLAQMSDDDLDTGKAIEDAVGHETEEVQADIICKGKWGSNEIFTLLILHVV